MSQPSTIPSDRPTTRHNATMGIPKSHRVDLDALRTKGDPPGLGLPIPVPSTAGTSPNTGFKVLSRPASHNPSPTLPHLPMDPSPASHPIMPGEMTPELASLASSRNNSGSSTPSRFITPLGGSVSNLSSMIARPLIDARRERYDEDLSTPTTTTEETTTTTGNEADIDSEPVTLRKKHSLRDLLIDSLSHVHHHTHHAQEPPLRTTGYQVRRSLDLSGPASYTPPATAIRRPTGVNRAQSEVRGLEVGDRRMGIGGAESEDLTGSRVSEWEEEDQVYVP
jgi:hypothetical protein